MTATAKPDSLLFRLRPADTRSGISRKTLKELAAYFDVSDTQVIHHALRKLADEVLPAYEPDDGPLTDEQMEWIRNEVRKDGHLDHDRVLISSLFD